jgi:hypothetical protein
MKRCCLIAIAVSCFLAWAEAQQVPAPNPHASKADVQKLFVVMNLRQQMLSVMDEMVEQQSQLMRESLKKRTPQITDAEIQRLDQAMHEMMKEFPYATMLNDMIPVYQKHLTQADVAAMTTFYSSPTGKKLLREMPAMTAESMQAAYPIMQAHMEKVMARIDEMTKEEEKKGPKP